MIETLLGLIFCAMVAGCVLLYKINRNLSGASWNLYTISETLHNRLYTISEALTTASRRKP